jgi:hypothetical protein
MSAAQDTLDRLNRTTRKLDALADFNYLKAKREIAQWRADDSEAENWRRDQMRKHAARCDEHQQNYDREFEAFGKKAPPPLADDFPPDYRRRLFTIGQSLLPSDHELAQFDPHDLDKSVIAPFEQKLFEALREQAANPTGDNLPETVDDPRARREVYDDDTGRKVIVYKAKQSFIKQLSRPGLRAFFYTPDTVLGGNLNWGNGARNWRAGFTG